MITSFISFLKMGGYAFYVWSAYGSVLIFLLIQWFMPWKRWQNYLRKQTQQVHE